MTEAKVDLDINEYLFPNLIHSEKAANYRKDRKLQVAEQLMPDLPDVGTGSNPTTIISVI